jgi:hypothetical protein
MINNLITKHDQLQLIVQDEIPLIGKKILNLLIFN